jgi:cation diffusion facilitator family transporter
MTSVSTDPKAQGKFAIRLSFATGLAMLAGKLYAWWLTNSAAIYADAAESVIHVFAVGFAALSFHLAARPATLRFPYGYERLAFFSAGFEGALIMLAALSIIYSAVRRWIEGLHLESLGVGTAIVAAAGAINALLGWYLLRTGRRTNSLILEANARHVLTDSWTSAGVLLGLLLVLWTGWLAFDPLVAIAAALNIMFSGGKLVWRSISGLLDYSSPETRERIHAALDQLCRSHGIQFHDLRFRSTGYRLIAVVHLLFPFDTPLGRAHAIATDIELRLPSVLGEPVELVSHLESLEDHMDIHAAPSNREIAPSSES